MKIGRPAEKGNKTQLIENSMKRCSPDELLEQLTKWIKCSGYFAQDSLKKYKPLTRCSEEEFWAEKIREEPIVAAGMDFGDFLINAGIPAPYIAHLVSHPFWCGLDVALSSVRDEDIEVQNLECDEEVSKIIVYQIAQRFTAKLQEVDDKPTPAPFHNPTIPPEIYGILCSIGHYLAKDIIKTGWVMPKLVDIFAPPIWHGMQIALTRYVAVLKNGITVKRNEEGCRHHAISILLTQDPDILELVFTPDRKTIRDLADVKARISELTEIGSMMLHLAYEMLGIFPASSVAEVLDVLDPVRLELLRQARFCLTSPNGPCKCKFCLNWQKMKEKIVDNIDNSISFEDSRLAV